MRDRHAATPPPVIVRLDHTQPPWYHVVRQFPPGTHELLKLIDRLSST